ncbi:MAG: hypothetical protein IIB14_04255, partial [Chloroflexi bacterium]|nr:hypothetical protein [Chloroflexota bacterium]
KMSTNRIVQEIQDPGGNLLKQAITSNQFEGTLDSTEVSEEVRVQSPYRDIAKKLLDFDINLVGVIRDGEVHVRLDNLALTQKDVLVYICSSRTDWPSLRALLDS